MDNKSFQIIRRVLSICLKSYFIWIGNSVTQFLLLICLWVNFESLEVDEEKLGESTDCHLLCGHLLGEASLAVQLVITIEQLFHRESLQAVAERCVSLYIDA